MIRLIALVWLVSALTASAADYRSVAVAGAIMYDAPSAKAQKLFVVAQGYPVEITVSVENWAKVRDLTGQLAWIERKVLSDKRTVVVTAVRADIRQSADDSAPIVFQAEKGVALEFMENVPGLVKVRHRDGQAGYIRLSQVFGA